MSLRCPWRFGISCFTSGTRLMNLRYSYVYCLPNMILKLLGLDFLSLEQWIRLYQILPHICMSKDVMYNHIQLFVGHSRIVQHVDLDSAWFDLKETHPHVCYCKNKRKRKKGNYITKEIYRKHINICCIVYVIYYI